MNSLQFGSNFSARIDNLTLGGSSNSTLQISGSDGIAGSETVNNSTWTQLTLGLSNVRALWMWNDNTVNSSSVITVASGSAGAGNPFAMLSSGDSALIPWSGSTMLGIYAKIVGGTDTTGVVQYSAINN